MNTSNDKSTTRRSRRAARRAKAGAKVWRGGVAAMGIIFIVACSGGKPTVSVESKRYERAPIVETTEEALKAETMMIDAKMKQETGREGEAMALYRKIVSQGVPGGAADYELSRMMAESGMTDSAIYYANEAVSRGKGNVWYLLHLASLYQYSGQMDKCTATWETIVAENSDETSYYIQLSDMYVLNKEFKKAIEVLNRVERRIGVSEPVSLQKSKLWRALGREDKAMEEIKALADAMPQEGRYNAIIAEAYMSEKAYDKAKVYYDRALASDPDDEYLHISIAEYYKAKGMPRKAYEELKEGFKKPGLSTANKIQILTTFYSSEEFYGPYSQYAYDLLNDIMSQSEDSTSYAAFYGDVLMRQERYAEARDQFALALTSDSSKYEIWEALLASELQGHADPMEMQRDAERAAALFPLHPMPYYVQSVAAYDRKDYGEALKLAQRCEQIGFDEGYLEAETYMMIAACYIEMKDRKSIDYLEKYLQIHPNDVVALNSYAYQLALAGEQLGTAERISKTTLKAKPDDPHYMDTYAWILHLQGRDKEALPYIEKAHAMLPDNEEISMHYEAIRRGQ